MRDQTDHRNTKHLSYNAGGYCYGFESIIRNNIVYPELKTNLFDKYSVPLKIRISKDGHL